MDDTLKDTIRFVRRRAWIAKILFGCGWVSSIIALWLLVIGSVDFILRQNDRFSRITLSFLFALAVVSLTARFILPLIRNPLSDLSLAQRIQGRFPMLRHKIATAVEFLHDEKTVGIGSDSMRREVIREASEALRELPVREVVHYRHAMIAFVIGLLSVATLATAAFLLPSGARIAIERLMNPFGDTVWPQVNDLAFQNTASHIPVGGLFEAELTDRKNKLPKKVNIEYRFQNNGAVKTVVEPMQQVNGVMVAQRQDVQHAFQFRAVGGDDETEWHTLQPVVPPEIRTVEFKVHPPVYTGWPLQLQSGQIWGLAGSRVTLEGTASVPLASATLTTTSGDSLPLKIDGERFALIEGNKDWLLRKNGTALIRVVDRHGVEGGDQQRVAVRVVPESPPTVQIEKPTGYYRASPDAMLPLEIFAKDNLALRDVTLHFQSVGDEEQSHQPILLWQQQQKPDPPDRKRIEQQVAEGEQQLVKYAWDLTAYRWPAGTEVAFYASAYDNQPAEGRSEPDHVLQIIDKETLAQELALRQQGLIAELARIVTREKQSHERTSQLKIAWEQIGQLTQKEVQTLRSIGLTENEIRRAISDAQDGLMAKTATLAADLRHNRISDPVMSSQLEQLVQTLRSVEAQQLNPLQSALTAARKHAQNGADPAIPTEPQAISNSEGVAALSQAKTYQREAIASLQPLVDALLQSNRYRRLTQDLVAVTEKQKTILKATEGLTGSLSGRPLEQLSKRERVALRQTAEQQETLQRELDELIAQMRQTSKELSVEKTDSGDRLASAVAIGREQGVSQQMGAAQDHLDANQIGQALTQQTRATETLDNMLATLEGMPQTNFAERIEKLLRAEAQVARLASAQEKLQKEQTAALSRANESAKDSANVPNSLKNQRQTLEDKLEALSRQIESLQASAAAKSLGAAAEKTMQAGVAAEQRDANASRDQDEAAAELIAKASNQLTRARQQAEAAQLNSLLARLPEQLQELVASQEQVLKKTLQAAEHKIEKPKLTRLDKARIIELSRRQLAIIAQTQPIREGLERAEILQYVLTSSLEKMQTSAEKLGQFQVGSQTQRLQHDVIHQLKMISKSLQRDPGTEDSGTQGGGGGGGQGSGAEQKSGERSLAEIRLLKLIQVDLNRRIASIQMEMEQADSAGSDLQPFIKQLQELGPEQAKLAIWTLGLLRDNASGSKQQQGKALAPKRTEL